MHEQSWENYALFCSRWGCPDYGTPQPAAVGINQTDFEIINATFRPQLIDQRTMPGGTIEIRKVVEELPGGQTKVMEQRVIVNRPPKPGEEAAPAQIEKMYSVLVIHNGIEYNLLLQAYWKQP
jgi:hypothetical protein